MSESRHSKGDAANVGTQGATGRSGSFGHIDLRELEGEVGSAEVFEQALSPEEIAEHYNRGEAERRQRRERRQRMETYRARLLLAGGALWLVLLLLGHAATAFGILLLVVLAAMEIRRRGR